MKPVLALYGIPDRYRNKYPAYVHDHNLTLWCDGRVERYVHLERLTRRKMDNRLPERLEAILDEWQLREFDLVSVNSFVGDQMITHGGRLRVGPASSRRVDRVNPGRAWCQTSAWEGYAPVAATVSHELAHVYSCIPFFGPFRENSLLVHFDGGASCGNFSAWLYCNGRAELLECHWELSHLSKLFNDNALSFALMQSRPGEHGSVPGKLMGYAAMGTPNPDLEDWLMSHDYFRDIWHNQSRFSDRARTDWNWKGDLSQNDDAFLMDIAACFQAIFQRGITQKIEGLRKQTGAEFLYYTGGCALNIRTNTQLVDKGEFRRVFIPPCCNDAGLSLGAAAAYASDTTGDLHSPYLNGYGLSRTFDYSTEDIRCAASMLVKGKIIGVCNGYGEAGPRALGNRSVLARADSRSLAQNLSRNRKGREWFRPVAPVMLERNALKYTGYPKIDALADFMLLDFPILPAYQNELAGVVHQNGTARIQTIRTRNQNPYLFDLLTHLDEKYQLGALINTSFNRRGEPIVHTPADASAAATSMALDGLVINGTLWTGPKYI